MGIPANFENLFQKLSGSHGAILLTLLVMQLTRTSATVAASTEQVDEGSFYYGTQTMLCLAASPNGPSPLRLLSRRSADPPSAPWRADFVYIHRLFRYRGHVFEWGSGARGFHVGPAESVTDCPVTWEDTPAGRSDCPPESLANWTGDYRRRYGGYNILTNNCHHFANRAAALLLSCHGNTIKTTTEATPADDSAERVDEDVGGPSRPMKAAWKFVSWVISMASDIRRSRDAASEEDVD
jgi:hypothetical protein